MPTAPRLVVGAVYKHLGEMMKLLWGPSLKMNTVHVRDVVRAMWHVTRRSDTIGQIYNVVDESDSTQGSISALVSELFNINHDYWGTALSNAAKVRKKNFRINDYTRMRFKNSHIRTVGHDYRCRRSKRQTYEPLGRSM